MQYKKILWNYQMKMHASQKIQMENISVKKLQYVWIMIWLIFLSFSSQAVYNKIKKYFNSKHIDLFIFS